MYIHSSWSILCMCVYIYSTLHGQISHSYVCVCVYVFCIMHLYHACMCILKNIYTHTHTHECEICMIQNIYTLHDAWYRIYIHIHTHQNIYTHTHTHQCEIWPYRWSVSCIYVYIYSAHSRPISTAPLLPQLQYICISFIWMHIHDSYICVIHKHMNVIMAAIETPIQGPKLPKNIFVHIQTDIHHVSMAAGLLSNLALNGRVNSSNNTITNRHILFIYTCKYIIHGQIRQHLCRHCWKGVCLFACVYISSIHVCVLCILGCIYMIHIWMDKIYFTYTYV